MADLDEFGTEFSREIGRVAKRAGRQRLRPLWPADRCLAAPAAGDSRDRAEGRCASSARSSPDGACPSPTTDRWAFAPVSGQVEGLLASTAWPAPRPDGLCDSAHRHPAADHDARTLAV